MSSFVSTLIRELRKGKTVVSMSAEFGSLPAERYPRLRLLTDEQLMALDPHNLPEHITRSSREHAHGSRLEVVR